MRFLDSLDIPLVATLRDTQNYVRAADSGLGVYEMPRWQVQQDWEHWLNLSDWLNARRRSQPLPVASVAVSEAS
jgi:chromosome partitioning protein